MKDLLHALSVSKIVAKTKSLPSLKYVSFKGEGRGAGVMAMIFYLRFSWDGFKKCNV